MANKCINWFKGSLVKDKFESVNIKISKPILSGQEDFIDSLLLFW